MATDERYSRQSAISGWEQERVERARVAIVGVGAFGNIVAADLARVGVGVITLIDDDVVETSNLSRQPLFSAGDIGRPKVEAAADALGRINPAVDVSAVRERLEGKNAAGLLAGSDVVVSAVDNFGARRAIVEACARLNIPVVNGGMFGFTGEVQVFDPNNGGACPFCLGLPKRTDRQRCGRAPLPSVVSMASIIAGAQTAEVLKLICPKIGGPMDGVLTINAARGFYRVNAARRNPDCEVCGQSSKRARSDKDDRGDDEGSLRLTL